MTAQTNKDELAGNLLAFCGALLLSFDALFIKLINGSILEVSYLRGVFLFLGTSAILLVYKIISRQSLSGFFSVGLLPVGFLYGLASVFFVGSLTLASIGTALVIIATAPLIAAIASVFLLQEKIRTETWIASIIAFIGLAIVAFPTLSVEGTNSLGMIAALATAICMALAFTVSRKSQGNMFFAPAIGGALSAVLLTPIFLYAGAFRFSPEKLPLMLVEGGLLVPVALGLIAVAPRYIPSPAVGLFLLIETILGPFWVWLFLNEAITAHMLIGGALVILSLLGNTFYNKHSRNTRTKQEAI